MNKKITFYFLLKWQQIKIKIIYTDIFLKEKKIKNEFLNFIQIL